MLTIGFTCTYNGGIETVIPDFRPRKNGVFLLPFGRIRTGNILNTRQRKYYCVNCVRHLRNFRRYIEKVIQMTNSISIYNFNQNQIRTQLIDDNPWFCHTDCCKALGLKNGRMSAVKDVKKIYTPTTGGQQELTFINEPNLYRLIFRSNKPQAQAFADWVYSEVLPSIRKTGAYVSTPAPNHDKDTMKAMGGLVKRCCSAAIREELISLFNDIRKQQQEKKSRMEEIKEILSMCKSTLPPEKALKQYTTPVLLEEIGRRTQKLA